MDCSTPGFPAAAAAKSLQSCLTLCDPIPEILQARTLEWVAISFSSAWKWKVKSESEVAQSSPMSEVGVKLLFVTPWIAAYRAPPSIHHQLLELTQTHVHQVGDAIQPSHPLSSPSPPAFSLSQHQGLFQWVSSHQVAKVLELQPQHQSFQWIFRTDVL